MTFKDPFYGGNGAVPHGIVRTVTGQLVFDVQRYSVAVYRRKQARRAQALVEQLGKVADDIRTVNSYLDDESQAESVPGIAVDGEPLIGTPARPLALLEAVERVLRPALVDAASVQRRIAESD